MSAGAARATRVLQFYPLAGRLEFGLLVRRGEKPAAARFLTPEKAKTIARAADLDRVQ